MKQELEDALEDAVSLRSMVSSLRLERDQLEREIQQLHMEYPTLYNSPIQSDRRDVSEQTEPSDFINYTSVLCDSSNNELMKEHEIKYRLQV